MNNNEENSAKSNFTCVKVKVPASASLLNCNLPSSSLLDNCNHPLYDPGLDAAREMHPNAYREKSCIPYLKPGGILDHYHVLGFGAAETARDRPTFYQRIRKCGTLLPMKELITGFLIIIAICVLFYFAFVK